MYKSFYKTDKQKRNHINRYWPKQYLFDVIDSYTEDDEPLHTNMLSCKTKKELLDKYLEECWEFIWEEYSYA